jgi:peptide/nickel transport system permease protein
MDSSTQQQKDTTLETHSTSTVTTEGTTVLSTATVGAAGLPGIGAPSATAGRMRDFWRLVTQNRKVGVGVIILAIFVLIAIVGPFFVYKDPNAFIGSPLQAPSATYWLGTTQTGQDVFAQLLVGTRTSMFWGFLTAIAITIISTAIGLIAGYFGGLIDDVLSILINVFLVLPGLPLAIVLAAFFSTIKGDFTVALALTVTSWSWGARVIRAQTMSMRNRDFVEAARSNGESTWRILCAEILPNEIAIVMSGFIGTTIYVILAAAGLEFLGLGNSTSLSWGTMLYWVNNNDAILQGAYWWFIPPILCLALVGTGLSLINFGVDEIANPRLRSEVKPKVKPVAKVKAVA